MKDEELIESLKECIYGYIENGDCTFNPAIAVIIVNRLGELVNLTKNYKNNIKTNQELDKTEDILSVKFNKHEGE